MVCRLKSIKDSRSQPPREISNGTSAQLGYTVPFTLVHPGKCRTGDKLKTQT